MNRILFKIDNTFIAEDYIHWIVVDKIKDSNNVPEVDLENLFIAYSVAFTIDGSLTMTNCTVYYANIIVSLNNTIYETDRNLERHLEQHKFVINSTNLITPNTNYVLTRLMVGKYP